GAAHVTRTESGGARPLLPRRLGHGRRSLVSLRQVSCLARIRDFAGSSRPRRLPRPARTASPERSEFSKVPRARPLSSKRSGAAAVVPSPPCTRCNQIPAAVYPLNEVAISFG